LGGPAGQPPADDLLRSPRTIDISRIDKRAASVQEPVQLLMRLLLAGLHPEGHRAQRQTGHRAATAPQRPVIHTVKPMPAVVGLPHAGLPGTVIVGSPDRSR